MGKIVNGKRWGRWEYHESNLTLEFRSPDGQMEVDLEDCNDCGEILDWILHMTSKGWAKPEDIGNLVYAFMELSDYNLYNVVQGEKMDFRKVLLG